MSPTLTDASFEWLPHIVLSVRHPNATTNDGSCVPVIAGCLNGVFIVVFNAITNQAVTEAMKEAHEKSAALMTEKMQSIYADLGGNLPKPTA